MNPKRQTANVTNQPRGFLLGWICFVSLVSIFL